MSAGTTATEPGRAFQEREVEADGFRVRCWEAGRGEALICLPGAGGPQMSRALDLLAEHRRVVVVELPGLGGSPRNERTRSAPDMAETVAAAAAALGLERYAVLGTSVGGVVALWLALAHPDRVSTLVLEAPGAFRRGTADTRRMTPEQSRAAINRHPERVPWKDGRDLDPDRLPLVMRLLGPEHDEELESRLEGIEAPVLVLYGSHDGLFSPDMGRAYVARIPRGHFVIVYDAAHDIQGDRPEAFAEVVGDFLARGPAFLVNDRPSLIHP